MEQLHFYIKEYSWIVGLISIANMFIKGYNLSLSRRMITIIGVHILIIADIIIGEFFAATLLLFAAPLYLKAYSKCKKVLEEIKKRKEEKDLGYGEQ